MSGSAPPPHTDESKAAPSDATEHSAWFVVIDGQEQGPFPADELCAMVDRSTIQRDALVSRLGDSATRPLRDVPELRALLGPESLPTLGELSLNGGNVTLEFEDVPPDAIVSSVPPPPSGGAVAAVTVHHAPPAPPPVPPPIVRPLPPREARRPSDRPSLAPPIADGDLEPIGDTHIPLFAKLPTIDPPVPPAEPRGVGEKLTGARNEGSLLFRVDKDTVAAAAAPGAAGMGLLFGGDAPSAAGSSDAPPAGNPSDVSGLLELQSLARKMAALSTERKDKPAAVDELLGVNPTGTLASPLAAPPIAAPPRATRSILPSSPPPANAPVASTTASGNRTMFMTAVVVALIVTGGLGLIQVLLHRMEQDRAPRVVQVLPAPVVVNPAPVPEAHPTPPPPTPPTPSVVTTPEVQPVVPSVVPSVPPRTPTVRPPTTPPSQTTRPPTNPSRTPVTPPVAPAVPTPPTPTTPEVNRDLPVSPERAAVQEAMRNLAPVVRACGIEGDPAVVTITFANTGRVTTANVAPPYAGTASGSCMARAVRGARLPPFQQNTFEVRYPFTP